jgi:enoyl-CoA hydratase/carnithine racemase
MTDRPYTGRPAESFDFHFIRYEKLGYRATITFNRPEVLNCVNGPMLLEISAAVRDVSHDDALAVLVLTGAGERAFCTGADLKEQHDFLARPRDYYKWMADFIECHDRLRNLGKPSVARLNGIVVGGGNEFNLSCDLAIAADDIYIRQIGASHGSVAAAGATQFLPLVVGDRRAREILFLNEEITAAKALEWGLVNQVVPRAQLDQAVEAMVEKLTRKLPEATRYTKQQLNTWRDFIWGITIGHARDWLAIHNLAPETHEGERAFLEKREPDYEGLRRAYAEGEHPEYFWGAPFVTCPRCGARNLPEDFKYCGQCGQELPSRQ